MRGIWPTGIGAGSTNIGTETSRRIGASIECSTIGTTTIYSTIIATIGTTTTTIDLKIS